MKISLERSAMHHGLQQLGKVVPARSTLPILSSILITSEQDRVSLRATDLEISQIVYVSAKVEGEGSVAVPHRTLLDITSEMPEGELQISVGEEQKLEITTSFGTYSIMGKPVNEFPTPPEVDTEQTIRFPAAQLKRVIEKTAFAVSRDELKPSLMGVLFQFRDSDFYAVSTDGHRLVKYISHDFRGGTYQGENIVPVKFLNILFSYLVDEGEVTFYIGENHIMMRNQDTVLYTRVIDERFPDYETVFPKDNDKKLKVDREEMKSAVRRVSIFSNRTTHQVALHLSSGGLEITTEDAETVSSARETLSGEYTGDDIVIGYNSHYLWDMISHVDSPKVYLEFRSPVSAAVIFPEEQQENEDIAMLLMPIRLNE